MNKLPEITFAFWVMKICATTLGETVGDLLSMTLNIGYTVSSIILFGIFVITLLSQLNVKKYHPSIYWIVILSTSTVGTTISDFMDRTLQLGYVTGTSILVTVLCIIFVIWRLTGSSLSVSNVTTKKEEIFYWTAILCSNTLGTALGDFISDSSGLGFIGGAVLIGLLLVIIALTYYFTNTSRVFLFWAAFVLTRPFGATFGDVLTKNYDHGGLGFGTIGSSAVLAIIFMITILFCSFRSRQNPDGCLTIPNKEF